MYEERGYLGWFHVYGAYQNVGQTAWHGLVNIGNSANQPWGYDKVENPTPTWYTLTDAYVKGFRWMPWGADTISVTGVTCTLDAFLATPAYGYGDDDNVISAVSVTSSTNVQHATQAWGYGTDDHISAVSVASSLNVIMGTPVTGYGTDDSVSVETVTSDLGYIHSIVFYGSNDEISVTGISSTIAVHT